MKLLTAAQRKLLDDATRTFQEYWGREAARILGNPNADGWIGLIEILEGARKDKRVRTSAGAVDFLDLVIDLASDALTASTADQAIEPLNDVMPQAILGGKFIKGRKPNTGSPIRKRIAADLKKNPKLKPREVWAGIKAKHPKSWDVEGDTQIWVTGRAPMGYKRFSEVCAEEKKKLQA
jgi:hypothetical protein